MSRYTFHLGEPYQEDGRLGPLWVVDLRVEGTTMPGMDTDGISQRADYNGREVGRRFVDNLYKIISSSWLDENTEELISNIARLHTPPE